MQLHRHHVFFIDYSLILGTQLTSVAVCFPICATNCRSIRGTGKIPIFSSLLEFFTIQLQETQECQKVRILLRHINRLVC